MIFKKLKSKELFKFKVTVMSDFFIDRMIKPSSLNRFYRIAKEKEKLGGGPIRDISPTDIKDGNAINIAYCITKLCARVSLFTVADRIDKTILKETFKDFKNVKLNVIECRQGNTTSLEFSTSDSK